MSFSQAARYVNTPAAAHAAAFGDPLAGFSVPGIELTTYPNDPSCAVAEGDVCRQRSSNRRDHGYLTRLNIARASHPNAPYGCPDRGLECTVPHVRTTNFGVNDQGEATAAFAGLVRRRYRAQRLRDEAQERKRQEQQVLNQAVAGVRRAIAGERQRATWGSNGRHTEPSQIHYTPFPDQDNDYDLVMSPRR